MKTKIGNNEYLIKEVVCDDGSIIELIQCDCIYQPNNLLQPKQTCHLNTSSTWWRFKGTRTWINNRDANFWSIRTQKDSKLEAIALLAMLLNEVTSS